MANRSPVMQEYKKLDTAFHAAKTVSKHRPRSNLMQWSARHLGDGSELEAHNLISGTRQVIAVVPTTGQLQADKVADMIVVAVNNYDTARKMIRHMADALEKCLSCKNISWEAEHDGEILVRRAREYLAQ